MTKQEYINKLLDHYQVRSEYSETRYHTVNNDYWTIADMIIRQKLNNNGAGFGIVRVHEGYKFIKQHKQELIKLDMISKDGVNNAGFTLWRDYNF